MNLALKRYHHRDPRYVLRPEDRQIVRFAHQGDKQKSYSTEILDVSTTGMAFTIHRDHHPEVGDTIMVEFTVPGAEQMACFAKVVRIEELRKINSWDHFDELIIGVQFTNLRDPQIRNLTHGLNVKFKQLKRENQLEKLRDALRWIETRRFYFALGFFAFVVTAYIVFLAVSPKVDLKSVHHIPWGKKSSSSQSK